MLDDTTQYHTQYHINYEVESKFDNLILNPMFYRVNFRFDIGLNLTTWDSALWEYSIE